MSCGLPVPGPAEPFKVRTEPALTWYHVYSTRSYPGTNAQTFNEGWGDTRFAPIHDSGGTAVHTYYLATTRRSVYMESVLHDVVLDPPGVFDVAALNHFHLVEVRLSVDLQCVSFHTLDLPPLRGLTRAQLIDSLPACYRETRAWAQAAYLQRPTAQGIVYGSRRDDAARCLMLFKQRISVAPFEVLDEIPLAFGPARAEVLELVRSLDLDEV
jgi:hypothetical protein